MKAFIPVPLFNVRGKRRKVMESSREMVGVHRNYGAAMAGKRVLIVDDVITAGTAIRESHSMLTAIGAIPVGVSIALDRAEKRSLDDPVSAVQAVARDLKIPVISIVSLPQLQGFLRKSSDFSEDILANVTEYRSKYGV